MFFDEALGEILTAAPDYDPLVLKGFTYSTAFRAPADFLRFRESALHGKP